MSIVGIPRGGNGPKVINIALTSYSGRGVIQRDIVGMFECDCKAVSGVLLRYVAPVVRFAVHAIARLAGLPNRRPVGLVVGLSKIERADRESQSLY